MKKNFRLLLFLVVMVLSISVLTVTAQNGLEGFGLGGNPREITWDEINDDQDITNERAYEAEFVPGVVLVVLHSEESEENNLNTILSNSFDVWAVTQRCARDHKETVQPERCGNSGGQRQQ